MTVKEMTYEDWENQYKLIRIVDTHDLEELRKHDPKTLWTFCDSSGEGSYIVNGARWINRLEYYVTEKPWTDKFDIYVETR
jgi:hypothetical protein